MRLRPIEILNFASVYLFWGATYAAVKISVDYVSPVFATALRYAMAVLILLALLGLRFIWLRARNQRSTIRLSSGELKYGLGAGLVHATVVVLIAQATLSVATGTIAVLFAATPLLVVCFERARGNHVSKVIQWATVLGLAGIALLLSAGGGLDPDAPFQTGSYLVLAAAVIWAAFITWFPTDKAPQKIELLLLLQSGGAAALLLLIALATGGLSANPITHIPAQFWGATAFAAVFGSLLAFYSFYYLLQRFSGPVSGSYTLVSPLVAVIIGAALFSERLGWQELTGGAAILAATAVILFRAERKTVGRVKDSEAQCP